MSVLAAKMRGHPSRCNLILSRDKAIHRIPYLFAYWSMCPIGEPSLSGNEKKKVFNHIGRLMEALNCRHSTKVTSVVHHVVEQLWETCHQRLHLRIGCEFDTLFRGQCDKTSKVERPSFHSIKVWQTPSASTVPPMSWEWVGGNGWKSGKRQIPSPLSGKMGRGKVGKERWSGVGRLWAAGRASEAGVQHFIRWVMDWITPPAFTIWARQRQRLLR